VRPSARNDAGHLYDDCFPALSSEAAVLVNALRARSRFELGETFIHQAPDFVIETRPNILFVTKRDLIALPVARVFQESNAVPNRKIRSVSTKVEFPILVKCIVPSMNITDSKTMVAALSRLSLSFSTPESSLPEMKKTLNNEKPANAETPRAFGGVHSAGAATMETLGPVAFAVRFHLFSGTPSAVEKNVVAWVIDMPWEIPGHAALAAAGDG
jgi:hypothetical protein